MKKRVYKDVPNSSPPSTPKKTAPIDKVSTVKSGGIIITGEHIAKMWEASRRQKRD